MALFGTKNLSWNAIRSFRVMLAIVACVPLSGIPYGLKP